ncbi:MAG: hypothetical protein JST67_00035 [Bacteroidetes bacterium]|nr:hypothetical protein [Bacteroidota bacterium]
MNKGIIILVIVLIVIGIVAFFLIDKQKKVAAQQAAPNPTPQTQNPLQSILALFSGVQQNNNAPLPNASSLVANSMYDAATGNVLGEAFDGI